MVQSFVRVANFGLQLIVWVSESLSYYFIRAMPLLLLPIFLFHILFERFFGYFHPSVSLAQPQSNLFLVSLFLKKQVVHQHSRMGLKCWHLLDLMELSLPLLLTLAVFIYNLYRIVIASTLSL